MTRIIYVDTSAALKRALPEDGGRRLARAIAGAGDAGDTLVTSALSRIEISRGLRRREAELTVTVDEGYAEALQGVAIAPMTELVVELARRIDPPLLRSLDAIHVATALVVGADEVWTYDRRFAEAATAAGKAVRAPD